MNEEMNAKLREAKSTEEVAAIAKEYGKSNEELADEALDKVAGGKICSDRSGMYYCSNCGAYFPITRGMRHVKCPSCGAE